MPIYEYRCQACGHLLEALQKFSDEPLKMCPECSKPELEKQVSATSFQLKGTGWYATDFRDKGKPKPATTSESGSDTSKTEAKPTDTKETKSTDSKTGSSS